MKNNEYIKKIKDLYNKYKEAKKDPRKRAGMKLLGYFIFFFILLLLAFITSNSPKPTKNLNNTTTTTKVVDKYVEKQNKLLTNKYNIEYIINYNEYEYKINGTIENNIINGYLEDSTGIKKIIFKNKEIFEIKNNIENKINMDFNINYLSLEYIIDVIKQTSAYIQEKDKEKTYLYEIEENDSKYNIYIKTNENNIYEIEINYINNKYLLKFDN